MKGLRPQGYICFGGVLGGRGISNWAQRISHIQDPERRSGHRMTKLLHGEDWRGLR